MSEKGSYSAWSSALRHPVNTVTEPWKLSYSAPRYDHNNPPAGMSADHERGRGRPMGENVGTVNKPRYSKVEPKEAMLRNWVQWSKGFWMVMFAIATVIAIVFPSIYIPSFNQVRGYLIIEPEPLIIGNASGEWTSTHYKSWPYPFSFLLMVPSLWAFLGYLTQVIMGVWGTEDEKLFSYWFEESHNPIFWMTVAFVLGFLNINAMFMVGQGEIGFQIAYFFLFLGLGAFGWRYERSVGLQKSLGGYKEYTFKSDKDKDVKLMDIATGHYSAMSMFVFFWCAIVALRWMYTGMAGYTGDVTGYAWAVQALLTAYELFGLALILWLVGCEVQALKEYTIRTMVYDAFFGVFIIVTTMVMISPSLINKGGVS